MPNTGGGGGGRTHTGRLGALRRSLRNEGNNISQASKSCSGVICGGRNDNMEKTAVQWPFNSHTYDE